MSLTTTGTVLELTGIDLGSYAARDLTLEMQPIDPGELAFDANGTLHDLTMPQFRKYRFTISCTDIDAPELDDVWKGKLVSITILPYSGLAPADTDDNQQSFDCMVVDWTTSNQEWPRQTGWSLQLMQRS